MKKLVGVSLFSSAGLGELGLVENGIEIIAANELLLNRCKLYRENFPKTKMFEGDIWEKKNEIVKFVRDASREEGVFIVYATPPCQGMSSNGAGKLKAEVKAGNRLPEDARNRLIIPAMDVICAIKPEWVLFENVPNMKDTIIRTDDGSKNILDYISDRLGKNYVGCGEVVSCADYGIPQMRKRLITIFTKSANGKQYFESNGNTFFPKSERSTPLTLRDAIGSVPPLEAIKGKEKNTSFHPMHFVNVMKPEKHWWVRHTSEGDTAFNNQCVNPKCKFQGNDMHIDQQKNGKWESNKQTPIYCKKCKELLPRPSILDPKTKKRRLISGFHSAYRRMKWDEPSRALTKNLFFEASDNKVHPDQNRVLSLYEALRIQSISEYDYKWTSNGKQVSPNFIAHMIGESVPPKLVDLITKKMVRISAANLKSKEKRKPLKDDLEVNLAIT